MVSTGHNKNSMDIIRLWPTRRTIAFDFVEQRHSSLDEKETFWKQNIQNKMRWRRQTRRRKTVSIYWTKSDQKPHIGPTYSAWFCGSKTLECKHTKEEWIRLRFYENDLMSEERMNGGGEIETFQNINFHF